MNIRSRLALAGAVLLVGGPTAACGGSGGAPTDADEERFCAAADSMLADLIPEGMTDPELPSDEDMARAVRDWGQKMEEVGTPEDISEEARQGFESVVEQAQDVEATDFSLEHLQELEQGGAEASAEAREQAEAFGDYLDETCGDRMDDIELPELPDLGDSAG